MSKDTDRKLTEQALSDLVEEGLVEIMGIDADGEFRFRITEAGIQRAEAILGNRHE